MKVCLLSDGWASSTLRILLVNWVTKSVRISSLPCLSQISVAAEGHRHMFSKKWSLNSLTSWAKELMENDFRQTYHSHAKPFNIVRKVWHNKASEVLYNDSWTQKVAMCFIGLALLPNASKDERWKFTRIGFFYIFWMNSDRLEVGLTSPYSFDCWNSCNISFKCRFILQ